MAYCTVDDLKNAIPENVLVQLTDDEGIEETGDSATASAIAAADAEIDSYCGARYAVPFTAVPAVIISCSVDMAIYHLYSRRMEEIPETRAARYKNAVRLLTAIAKGDISLGTAATPTPSADASSAECTKTSDDRIFTRTKLRGF